MVAEDNFIVAIVLGSSKITAVAGRKQPDGTIQVLAYAEENSETFILRGRINNVTKMKQCLINMKEKLEKTLKKTISHAYVGIGGMGMHTVANTVIRQFGEKTVISEEIVDNMLQDNKASASNDRFIYEVVPQEFKIGTQTQIDPVGIPTDCLEGRYLNIIANGNLREDIDSCFRGALLKIAGLPISVLTLSDVILSESEKRSGCVFVDMGSETTSVAVFKNNVLRHFAVIPLGSANVNRDLSSLQIEDSEAEELKLQYGAALYEGSLDDKSPVKLKDGRQVKFEEFAGLVEARMEEIILNVYHQIELSKYDKSQLIGGIIVTGGAANMKNIEKAFETHTHFEKMRFVTKGGLRTPIRSNSADFNKDGIYNTALAIIDKAEFNCCGGGLGEDSQENIPSEAPNEVEKSPIEATATAASAANEPEEQAEVREEPKAKKQKAGVFRNFFKGFIDKMTDLVSEEDNTKSRKDA